MAYQAKIDVEEVRAALHLLVEDTFEIRVFGLQSPRDSSAYGTYSAYFDAPQIDLAASMVGRLTYRTGTKSGVYITLNPVHPGLKFKANAEWQRGSATGDSHILRRRWFPVDVDPKRIIDGLELKNIAASKVERDAAEEVSRSVWQFLIDEQGWPGCVLADSGNGSHALWRIEEPNDDTTRDLIQQCLATLDQRFTTSTADVDTAVFNASRIWKLYGTTGAKGSSTEERPHRRGEVLQYSEPMELVTRAQLEALAALYVPEGGTKTNTTSRTKTNTTSRTKKGTPGARPDPIRGEFDLEAWIDSHELELSKVSSKGGGVLYELAVCPWFGLEHATKAWVHHRQDGVISHGCQGGRCQKTRPELTWAQMRAHYEPEYAERQRAHLRIVRDDEPNQSSTETLNAIADIKADLIRTKPRRKGEQGTPKGCRANVMTILRRDPRLKGVLRWDQMHRTVVKLAVPPWRLLYAHKDAPFSRGEPWSDDDDTGLDVWLMHEYGFEPAQGLSVKCVWSNAKRTPYHPVREYLDALEWDGVERVNHWLINYCHAKDEPYASLVGRWWLIQWIARVYEPGCQADYTLVLEGAQGLKKSTGLKALCPNEEWFAEVSLNTDDARGAAMVLDGKWLAVIDELDGITRRQDVANLKAYQTRCNDRYRAPWGRHFQDVPRTNAFAGSVNTAQYLRDPTGARRYWPVKILRMIDVERIIADRDQILAEALLMYRKGMRRHPESEDEIALCTEQQERRMVEMPWEEAVDLWLSARPESETVAQEYKLTIAMERDPITAARILREALGVPNARQHTSDLAQIGEIMSRLGWTRRRISYRKTRPWAYFKS